MENIDTTPKNNQHLLLALLMESMLKLPEISPESQANNASATETVKSADQGEQIDLLA